jgi:hypothetical protein
MKELFRELSQKSSRGKEAKVVIKFPLLQHFLFRVARKKEEGGGGAGKYVKICSQSEINKFAKQFDKN